MEFLVSLMPLIVMFALFYFMLIRPQKKVANQKKQLLDALEPGDGVVTIGGLHAIVDEVDHQERIVVLDCEGVYLTYELNAIANVKKTVKTDKTSVEDLAPQEVVEEEIVVDPDVSES